MLLLLSGYDRMPPLHQNCSRGLLADLLTNHDNSRCVIKIAFFTCRCQSRFSKISVFPLLSLESGGKVAHNKTRFYDRNIRELTAKTARRLRGYLIRLTHGYMDGGMDSLAELNTGCT
jgi:hypothetical protein